MENSVYRNACSMLSDRLRWFMRNVIQYPELEKDQKFMSAFATAKNKLADLGHLIQGVVTTKGPFKEK